MSFQSKMKFANPRELFGQQVDLQITSMADIFTILLVFLLKSYSTSINNIQLVSSATLPTANHAAQIQEAPKVEIAKDAIYLDGKKITTLNNFVMDAKDQSLLEGLNPETVQSKDHKILVLADKLAPYSIVKQTLQAASAQGFTDYQLVVLGEAN